MAVFLTVLSVLICSVVANVHFPGQFDLGFGRAGFGSAAGQGGRYDYKPFGHGFDHNNYGNGMGNKPFGYDYVHNNYGHRMGNKPFEHYYGHNNYGHGMGNKPFGYDFGNHGNYRSGTGFGKRVAPLAVRVGIPTRVIIRPVSHRNGPGGNMIPGYQPSFLNRIIRRFLTRRGMIGLRPIWRGPFFGNRVSGRLFAIPFSA